MNAIQTALNSPRFNRLLLWIGVVVLAAGALTLVVTLMKSSDGGNTNPSPNFHPTLPAKQIPLTNASGTRIRTYDQLDPQVRSTVEKFIGTVVARKNLGSSWAVVSPNLKQGYTRSQWSHAQGLPVVPYPGVDMKHINYYLDFASTKEILMEVGLSGIPGKTTSRPATFQLALVPVGRGAHQQWLVDYWMPRWTPPVPT
ncbi:MAG TPA: hypothetical protein VLD16_16140 [Gaiellaceae bacterium]|nr:hypothetical protein [Gaiellaceae bacterium]